MLKLSTSKYPVFLLRTGFDQIQGPALINQYLLQHSGPVIDFLAGKLLSEMNTTGSCTNFPNLPALAMKTLNCTVLQVPQVPQAPKPYSMILICFGSLNLKSFRVEPKVDFKFKTMHSPLMFAPHWNSLDLELWGPSVLIIPQLVFKGQRL